MKFKKYYNFQFFALARSKINARKSAIGALGAHFAAMHIARADLKCTLLVASARLCALMYMCAPSTHVGSLHTISPIQF